MNRGQWGKNKDKMDRKYIYGIVCIHGDRSRSVQEIECAAHGLSKRKDREIKDIMFLTCPQQLAHRTTRGLGLLEAISSSLLQESDDKWLHSTERVH